MKLIDIKKLQYYYKKKNIQPWEIRIEKLEIEQQKNVFVYGKSGCGKSTFLGLVAGILKPISGSLDILKTDITKLTSNQRDTFRAQNMGYIFQQFNLVPYLTVKENILLPLLLQHKSMRMYQSKDNKQLKENFEYLVESLNLDTILNHLATEVSVGQAQRTAAARALILKPKIVLADEPTSALDEENQNRFMKILFEITKNEKSTLIFVSHNKSLSKYFDREILLSDYSQGNYLD